MRIANKSVSKVCQNNITNRLKAAYFGIKQQQKKLLIFTKKAAKPLENQELVTGALGGVRTHNLLIRSQMLYPVELRVRN